jgi:hypothetical protein
MARETSVVIDVLDEAQARTINHRTMGPSTITPLLGVMVIEGSEGVAA